ncbi:MAG: alpha/beta hydrolase family protein, partial [Bacteroidota bacterium]
GASYGGFMTMLLMTRTDLFATAISPAGISNITSYWGDGYWGYSYSSEATADSYPWNNKELYVEQSPIFHADKINTPLLLLTGDSDTNVPPGESMQLYTALKILDRPVELVMIKGEDHHIVTPSRRKKWHNVIMAWWDKHLKDQPQWWEEQFPEKNY